MTIHLIITRGLVLISDIYSIKYSHLTFLLIYFGRIVCKKLQTTRNPTYKPLGGIKVRNGIRYIFQHSMKKQWSPNQFNVNRPQILSYTNNVFTPRRLFSKISSSVTEDTNNSRIMRTSKENPTARAIV